jgi:hypothetical protein
LRATLVEPSLPCRPGLWLLKIMCGRSVAACARARSRRRGAAGDRVSQRRIVVGISTDRRKASATPAMPRTVTYGLSTAGQRPQGIGPSRPTWSALPRRALPDRPMEHHSGPG